MGIIQLFHPPAAFFPLQPFQDVSLVRPDKNGHFDMLESGDVIPGDTPGVSAVVQPLLQLIGNRKISPALTASIRSAL